MIFQISRSIHSTYGRGVITISLAPLPFAIPPQVTDETKPASPPIKGKLSPDDKRWLRGVARIKA